MDQVTQQNAALVEQAAAASEAMQEQAGQLAQAVGVFQLAGTPHAPARTTPPHTVAPKAMPALAGKPKAVPPDPARQAPVPAKRLAAAQGNSNDEWEEF